MATQSVSIEPVMKTVTVACTPEEAFRFFTADFGMWWPAATHSVVAYASQFKDKPTTVVLEPRVSGRIFERTMISEAAINGSRLVARIWTWGAVRRMCSARLATGPTTCSHRCDGALLCHR